MCVVDVVSPSPPPAVAPSVVTTTQPPELLAFKSRLPLPTPGVGGATHSPTARPLFLPFLFVNKPNVTLVHFFTFCVLLGLLGPGPHLWHLPT